ncbi:MAG: histidine kinase [Nocardioidaceae bacterium]|nr:histidine kinase [Nocardioidaceae bacterium]
MDSWLLVLLGAVVGAGLAAAATFRLMSLTRPRTASNAAAPAADSGPAVPPAATAVLSVLNSSAVLVGPGGRVVQASDAAYRLGLVHADRLVEPRLRDLVTEVRRDGVIRDDEVVVRRGRLTAAHSLTARVAPLDDNLVLVLIEDRTRERRVDEVRRDFVANVSHELKTPVGALSLLAEAVASAADDPDAVRRFATRMEIESDRLSRLVKQIIDLSRLQDDELLTEPVRVDVDTVVAYALDRSDTEAEARDIRLVGQTDTGLTVRGNLGQLQVALGNLVENAIAYSNPGTRVSVTAKEADGTVAITVTDQGVGIPEGELDRIFERFYRVDPARATATGGTGLGLSIVKHVAASHGGEVRVWSVERTGSSFTLVLPSWERRTAPRSDDPDRTAAQPDGPDRVPERAPVPEEATP